MFKKIRYWLTWKRIGLIVLAAVFLDFILMKSLVYFGNTDDPMARFNVVNFFHWPLAGLQYRFIYPLFFSQIKSANSQQFIKYMAWLSYLFTFLMHLNTALWTLALLAILRLKAPVSGPGSLNGPAEEMAASVASGPAERFWIRNRRKFSIILAILVLLAAVTGWSADPQPSLVRDIGFALEKGELTDKLGPSPHLGWFHHLLIKKLQDRATAVLGKPITSVTEPEHARHELIDKALPWMPDNGTLQVQIAELVLASQVNVSPPNYKKIGPAVKILMDIRRDEGEAGIKARTALWRWGILPSAWKEMLFGEMAEAYFRNDDPALGQERALALASLAYDRPGTVKTDIQGIASRLTKEAELVPEINLYPALFAAARGDKEAALAWKNKAGSIGSYDSRRGEALEFALAGAISLAIKSNGGQAQLTDPADGQKNLISLSDEKVANLCQNAYGRDLQEIRTGLLPWLSDYAPMGVSAFAEAQDPDNPGEIPGEARSGESPKVGGPVSSTSYDGTVTLGVRKTSKEILASQSNWGGGAYQFRYPELKTTWRQLENGVAAAEAAPSLPVLPRLYPPMDEKGRWGKTQVLLACLAQHQARSWMGSRASINGNFAGFSRLDEVLGAPLTPAQAGTATLTKDAEGWTLTLVQPQHESVVLKAPLDKLGLLANAWAQSYLDSNGYQVASLRATGLEKSADFEKAANAFWQQSHSTISFPTWHELWLASPASSFLAQKTVETLHDVAPYVANGFKAACIGCAVPLEVAYRAALREGREDLAAQEILRTLAERAADLEALKLAEDLLTKRYQKASWMERLYDNAIKRDPQGVDLWKMRADFSLDDAWHMRGGAFAKDTREDAWAPFQRKARVTMGRIFQCGLLFGDYAMFQGYYLGTALGLSWEPASLEAAYDAIPEPWRSKILATNRFGVLLPKWHGDWVLAQKFSESHWTDQPQLSVNFLQEKLGEEARESSWTKVYEDPVTWARVNTMIPNAAKAGGLRGKMATYYFAAAIYSGHGLEAEKQRVEWVRAYPNLAGDLDRAWINGLNGPTYPKNPDSRATLLAQEPLWSYSAAAMSRYRALYPHGFDLENRWAVICLLANKLPELKTAVQRIGNNWDRDTWEGEESWATVSHPKNLKKFNALRNSLLRSFSGDREVY